MMKMKKKLAMMLSIFMLTASCVPAAFAEEAGLVEMIVPADAAWETEKQVAAPGARISSGEDTVRVEITGEAGLAMYADLSSDTRYDLRAGDVVEFTGLSAGSYELEIDYHDVQKGVSAYRASVSVEGKAKQVAEPGTAISIFEDVVQVVVLGESGLPMYVDLGGDTRYDVRAGDTVEFRGLDAGTYDVEVDYHEAQRGVSAARTSVDVPGKAKQISAPGAQVSSSEDTVRVEITGEAGLAMYADLSGDTRYDLRAGDVVKFTDLSAGSYELEIDYHDVQKGVSAYRTSVYVEGKAKPVDPVTPPPSADDLVELITPPQGGHGRPDQKPSVMELGAKVTSGRNWIEVKVTEADEWRPVYVAVGYDQVKTAYLGETVRFSDLSAGKYDIEVDYVAPVSGVSPFRTSVDIEHSYAEDIEFSANGGSDSIDVIVTDASTLPITVIVKQGRREVARKTIEGGIGKASFEGLKEGAYSVVVNYDPQQWGVQAQTRDNVIVAKQTQGLKIHSVSAGENALNVTGSAKAYTDIALTTVPAASSAAIVRSDKNGYFSASIALPAGVYTQVKATYVADNTVYDIEKGNFVVSSSVERPALSVEPISNKTQKVIAWTEPGVKVNLRIKAYNYGQTVVADSNGRLKYSLPEAYPKGTEVKFTVYYGQNDALSYVTTVIIGKGTVYKTLQYGDTGDEVEEMTERLRDLGYMEDDVRRFSSAVREAVKTFQTMNGLKADGIAGQETLELLYSSSAVPYDAASGGTLSRGDKGSAVENLQYRLRDLGYYTIAVDGVYGSGTERAVRHFQRINGLEKTGVADSATLKLLYSSSAKKADSATADDYKTLTRSSTYHPAVVTLQRRLKELGYETGTADGYFGSQTYRAVRDFQKRNGLTATGIADEAMQRRLFSSSALPASGSSSSSAGSYRLLSWGSKGDDVLRLQRTLLSKGYTQVRVADGVYGQWTYDAVRAFQKDRGLSVDGIAGKDTQNALYGTKY